MAEIDRTEDEFRLEIPARAAWLATARLFVGAVARVCGLDGDEDAEVIADLKLATSEAVAGVVTSGANDVVILTITGDGSGRVTVTVGPVVIGDLVEAEPGPQPIDVITALLPEASVGDGVIRFSARSGAAAS